MITPLLIAFGTVLLAELPDKTMVAALVLTTRFRRPFAVWIGVAAAFLLHVTLAVTAGSLLRRLPTTPVRLVVALLFLLGGIVLLRTERDDEVSVATTEQTPFLRVALTSASVVGLAEFGDLTQLSTAGLAARYSAPIVVALGAWCALAVVAGLAVTAGSWMVRHVALGLVQRVAGLAFIAFGLLTAITTLA
ncbi:MAG: TMEM165/GDT1 family protein [Actinobacteria bacterium]|nr:TMEM165/GDT1 family protein [Actinomycetota bacterium]